MSSLDDEIRKEQEARKADKDRGELVGLNSAGKFDTDIYGNADKYAGFVRELPTAEEDAEKEEEESLAMEARGSHPATLNSVAPKSQGADTSQDTFERLREMSGSGMVNTRISDREGDVSSMQGGGHGHFDAAIQTFSFLFVHRQYS